MQDKIKHLTLVTTMHKQNNHKQKQFPEKPLSLVIIHFPLHYSLEM